MKVEHIRPVSDSDDEVRCEQKVDSPGTWYFKGKQDQCARYARFLVDGIPMCSQHAGCLALKHVMGVE